MQHSSRAKLTGYLAGMCTRSSVHQLQKLQLLIRLLLSHITKVMQRVLPTASDGALHTLRRCANDLAALSNESLSSRDIQRGITDVHRFRRIARSGTSETRNRSQEADALESFCAKMSTTLALRFKSAWRSVKEDCWEQPQGSVFSEVRIEGGDTSILTLLVSYKRSACVRKAVLRILSVLIAHDVDQNVETRDNGKYGEMRDIWAQKSGMSTNDITNVERTGRWYTASWNNARGWGCGRC